MEPQFFIKVGLVKIAHMLYVDYKRRMSALKRTISVVDAPPTRSKLYKKATKEIYGKKKKSSREVKYYDVSNASYEMDIAGGVTHLDVIAQGVTNSQRIGNSYRLNGCKINGVVYGQANALLNCGTMYLVYDSQPNTNLAGISDMFNYLNGYTEMTLGTRHRFRTLWRYDWNTEGSPLVGGTMTGKSSHRVCKYIKFPKDLYVYCQRNVASGSVSARETGALLLVVQGNNSMTGSVAATFSGTFRVYFSDE